MFSIQPDLRSRLRDFFTGGLNANDFLQAVSNGWSYIVFRPDGSIITANDNFLKLVEYDLKEIKGKHHRMFCDEQTAESQEYKDFWRAIGKGELQKGEFRRVTKSGNQIWLNANYTPIRNAFGRVTKVIKIASNVTDMVAMRDQANTLKSAVDTSWASIEFTPSGEIVDVNDNFLETMGYDRSEILGEHHRIFCDEDYAESDDYIDFWRRLANGDVREGEFLRRRKDGSPIWLQTAYTPLRNSSGEVDRILKIAIDISDVKFPVLRVVEILKAISAGDFTQLSEIESNGYAKEMGESVNLAVHNLNKLLGEVYSNSDLLETAARETLDMSSIMLDSTEEVSSSISEMAKGAQDQTMHVDKSSRSLEELRHSAETVAQSTKSILHAAKLGSQNSDQGRSSLSQVELNIGEIQDAAYATSHSINILKERSQEISQTSKLITEIAAKTNLLALNAAIEAANAGEAGRGFAVVAEEIRKLAEGSRSSAEKIKEVVTSVSDDVDVAVSSIAAMEESVKNGNSAINATKGVFENINQSSKDTLQLSEDVQTATASQQEHINSIVAYMEQVVVVSEENATSTSQISAATSQLNSGMERVGSSSEAVSQVASELKNCVKKFKLISTTKEVDPEGNLKVV